MSIKTINTKKKVFVIAEAGNNHEGNFSNAKKLVVRAAKAGADAIKFQTFITEELIHKKKVNRFNQLKKFELKHSQFKQLREIAKKNKIKFISTPQDISSAKFLIKIVDIVKIASNDNNFFPMLDVVLRSKKPIIISTGMTTQKDIKNLIKYISKKISKKMIKKKISLLHCVTSYPVEDKYVNLNSIPYLIKTTKLNIGYSDHSLGNEACLGAVVLGAKIIEKHFTLDKKFSKFRDHALSADFIELKQLVHGIRKLEHQIGYFKKFILKPEKTLIKVTRKAPYARRDIYKGEKFNLKNIVFLRNTNSSSFLGLQNIIGKKAKIKISKDKRIDKKYII
tara:strand:- start:51 stop:1061 length:1011 start_codon:yes stop_codon:yes gene_type:complete